MNRFGRWTWAIQCVAISCVAIFCVATVVLTGCRGGDEPAAAPAVDDPEVPASLDLSGTTATDDKIGEIPASLPNKQSDPVIDLDPTEYTSYLAQSDDTGSKPIFKELKAISAKYENGKMKRAFEVKVYENRPPRIHGEFSEWWDNGEIWKKGRFEDGKQVGDWEFRSSKGRVTKSGTYASGRPDGKWSFFRNDGTLQRVESYAQGKKDGAWTEYDTTGKISLQQIGYKDGERHGASIQWFPLQEGQDKPVINWEIQFVEGRQHGKALEWYANGQLRNEMEFRNGKRHGRGAQWDEQGNLVNEVQFRDGELQTRDGKNVN